MPRRNNKPALYELTKSKQDRDLPAEAPSIEKADGSGEATTWLTPGAGVRIPGGFLFLAAVLLVILVGFAWWLGFNQGVAQTESLMAARPGGQLVDPLLIEPVARSEASAAEAIVEPSTPPRSPLDSRKPWHFVLAETNKEGAERLAGFCRGQGLEVLVVPRHNTGLARVIALPGMATSSRQTEEARAQDSRIATLGRQWKRNGGRTDFSDRYVDRIVAVVE